ncbi:sensor histidine kinase [Alloprevotella rava]|uniref:histidine kinase n=1 Tax=Alloprevotella rava TaxID=671218 RepID=A0A7W5UEK5_9BACT|nr:HAMP domain-containing sensor histidine kinase [Alloprevotella rava]MBB3702674.1 signal transduction histidine kinase [Alloprevotella rava]
MSHVKVALVVAAVLIAAVSLLVSNLLVRDLTREEQSRMEVWAEAMSSLTRADENTDLNLVLKVINGNNTIPVIVQDSRGEILAARNVEDDGGFVFWKNRLVQDSIDIAIIEPHTASHKQLLLKLQQKVEQMQQEGYTMKMNLDGAGVQTTLSIFYEPSLMLRRLALYPYIQLGVVALFIVVALLALLSSKRAEQNKVWVGLSRETAHQLGTPISSLMAGVEMLKDLYPDEALVPEMDKDIQRLQLIAERFSKIGSAPALDSEDLRLIIPRVVEYIGRRTSDKVQITTDFPSSSVFVRVNAPLFEWVIENLCKNAIDAMAGVGHINICVRQRGAMVNIEVSDTGKGISKKRWKRVFKPGFTTKQRGWGLGLSLAKRIVEEYHEGHIFVKASEINHGTTFCLQLKADLQDT